MNILLFSQAAWDDTNSYGNTVASFFGDWEQDRFFHFYTRKQLPRNDRIEKYYNVSVVDIVKGLLGRGNRQKMFSREMLEAKREKLMQENKKEQQSIRKIHQKKNPLIYWVTEQIWLSRIWIDRDFKRFIAEANPDIFFAFAANSFILWPLIQYVKKHTQAKIVLFAADDVSSDNKRQVCYRRYYLAKTLKKCILAADKLYGISPSLCEQYAKEYGKEVTLLTKGCEFTEPVATEVNTPVRLAYAGNLYYGRDEILGKVARTLQKINQNGTVAQLEVYTPAIITEEIDCALNIEGTSRIMGPRPYEQIKQILHEADVVLHVESFQEEQIEYVRHSFSTKIIDCLQSGNAILAVGPADVNSIAYMKRVPGTVVVEGLSQLEEAVMELVGDKNRLLQHAAAIRDFAVEHHDLKKVRQGLHQDFCALLRQ